MGGGSGGIPFSHLPWRLIILGVFAAVAAILFVGFPLLIFIVALFEKNQIRMLAPVGNDEIPDVGGDVVRQAVPEGFALIGTFTDGDTGIKRGIITLMLSPDAQVLLWINRRKVGGRHKLMTRMDDGTWLITTNLAGAADLSGIVDERMLPAAFDVLVYYHRQRVAQSGRGTISFNPATLVDELYEHDKNRVEQMHRNGMIRWNDDAHTNFTATRRGAIRLAKFSLMSMSQLSSARKLADATSIEMMAARQFPQSNQHEVQQHP